MKKLIRVCLFLLLGFTVARGQIGNPASRSRVPDNATPARTGDLEQRVGDLAEQISHEMSENQKRTVAVVEFVDLKGKVTDFGRFLAEELITRLYQTHKFKVIERQQLNRIIAEQKLSLTGIVDPASAKQLGKILGVDAIASGTVTDLGRTLKINARLIDTSTAEVFAVASTEIARDESVSKLMGVGDDSTSSGDKGGGGAQPPPKRVTRKVDAQFFTFDLQSCRLSGTAVACDFVITNNDKDRKLNINRGVIFDEAGNRTDSNHMELANTEGYNVSAYLISGVATRARVAFTNVSPSATRITLLHIDLWADGGGEFNIEYRNLPLRETGAGGGAGESDEGSARASSRSDGERSVLVYGNQQWTDTGIDVEPGMRLEVVASGKVYISKQPSVGNVLLGGVLGNSATRLPPRSVGPSALLAKIRFTNGGESKTVVVGEKNTLTMEQGEFGRLLLGINDRNVSDNSGYFTVKVRW